MKIAKETWIILAIGLADLVTTILFIRYHGAQEANPLFKRYWEMGIAAFVGAKVAMLIGPLSVLEWARRRNPRFVSLALRSAIVGYVGMYGVGYARLNYIENAHPTFTATIGHRHMMSRRFAERMRRGFRSARQNIVSERPDTSETDIMAY